jgi:methylmalonyl-CoA mutase
MLALPASSPHGLTTPRHPPKGRVEGRREAWHDWRMSDRPFLSQFPQAGREAWLALVETALKGKDVERTLVARSHDGLRIEPLRPAAKDTAPLVARAPGRAWSLVQRIDHRDPEAANAQALEDLAQGAGGLNLVFAGAVNAHGFGLDATPEAISAALDGIHLDAAIDVHIDAGRRTREVAQALGALVKRGRLDPGATHIRFGFDPLGTLALTGEAAAAWSDMAPRFAAALADLHEQGFAGPLAAADGRIVHAAGGSEGQELAFALAGALAYLRALEAAGWPLADAAAAIEFKLAADQDQFLSIAKFRAIRLLWARVQEACGLAPQPGFVSAETAWRMQTRRDPWVNLLRDTVAVFAAGVAGADAVTVLPFTQALGLPDGFARRLARNTQLVLIEEAHLARVSDPAAGSGGLEAITQDLAEAAWGLFQAIEAQGGLFAALAGGSVQAGIGATRRQRQDAVARLAQPLTGVSAFPDLAETPVAVLDTQPWPGGARSLNARVTDAGPTAPAKQSAVQVDALTPLRLAEPFEELRDAADAASPRPAVFLAQLGTAAEFTARSRFAKNLFEAGGLAAIGSRSGADGAGASDLAALVAEFLASGVPLVCICASDAVYAHEAAAAVAALKEAGARAIYLAGRPGENEAALRAAGITAFAFAGCDAPALLAQAQADART